MGRSFLATRLNRLGVAKLVEPTCSLGGLVVSKPFCACPGICGRVCCSAVGGFDLGRSFLATRLNRLGVAKLVEPACSLGGLVVSKPWWGCSGTWGWV